MSIGASMLPTRNYMKGMLVGSLAFLGLSFCSPPAPAMELKNIIRQDQAKCLADNMYFEARNQSWRGIVAVGMVTLNRVSDKRFPEILCEVVKQGPTSKWWLEQKGKIVPIRHKCQFSWYCDGKSDEPKDSLTWIEAIRVADIAMQDTTFDLTDGALWYHADYVLPYWAQHLEYVLQIENHIFYK